MLAKSTGAKLSFRGDLEELVDFHRVVVEEQMVNHTLHARGVPREGARGVLASVVRALQVHTREFVCQRLKFSLLHEILIVVFARFEKLFLFGG